MEEIKQKKGGEIMNIDQLNEMSDYEINCAVAENLELIVTGDPEVYLSENYLIRVYEKDENGDRGALWATLISFVDMARYYMPIAIEHGISIYFSTTGEVSCVTYDDQGWATKGKDLNSTKTGRAVCIAFLLMNGESK